MLEASHGRRDILGARGVFMGQPHRAGGVKISGRLVKNRASFTPCCFHRTQKISKIWQILPAGSKRRTFL